MQTDSKTIAKNTLFLYVRMIFVMLVTLYTSRVILQKLGVDDFGIYQAVGGIVGMLSFVNAALATGSSRFLTYALGENNFEKLRKTFSTTLNIHILVAIITVVIAETAGLWFLYHKMVIAPERMSAAVYTYQISIITAVIVLTQVPYNAVIISHERMSVYAYTSIIEVCAKLGICFLLSIGDIDKLKLYATLILLVQVGVMGFYRFYCVKQFPEARFSLTFDRKIFREIAGFSGWSMFASTSIALNNQGILILLNMFFSPAIVAARSISLQVNVAANQLVANFRQAANPQIIKKFAAGDELASKQLLLTSTTYSYYLMLIISLPVCLLANPLLKFWLDVVPEYTTPFLQIVVIQSLFQVFDTSFYTALYAKGRLKENALTSPMLGFLIFPITYVFFKLGYSPLVLSWTSLIVYAILGCILKPILVIKIVDYTWGDIWKVFRPCIIVTLLSIPIPLMVYSGLDCYNVLDFIVIALVSIVSVAVFAFLFGVERSLRVRIISSLMARFKQF